MPQALELFLLQFLMPDNDARRKAEDQIKRLVKDPQAVPALIHYVRNAKTPNVRQLSAVLLRKKIAGHWAKLSPDLRRIVKQSLIESIAMESSPPVRRASANVVSIIAKFAVPRGEWPDLLPFLFQYSQSAEEEHREMALILFNSLTETIGASFQLYFAELQLFLLKCLQDENSNHIRVAALKAVGSFLESTHDESEVIKFCELIPSILNFSRRCLASSEEDVAIIAFEIFDELIERPVPLPGESVKAIVQFSLEVSLSQNLESTTRHQAIQIISWLAKYKPNSLKKHNLIIPVLQIMCLLLTDAANSDEDDDLSPDRAAAEVIDTMSLKLSKHTFLPVLEFAFLSSQSADPKFREASVMVLGVISEGCMESMKVELEPVLHIVVHALRDPEQVVRGAASSTFGQFAEYLQPEIISHYERVIPCIVKALQDPSDDVKEKSCYALAAFCENMGDDIHPFVDSLVGILLAALQNGTRILQETCMSAIGSIASAAQQTFVPYAERVLELMKIFMILTNNKDLRARARATELVGIITIIAGRARMEPILPPFIEAAISGYGLGYSELREYTHGFFSNMAKVLEDGMVKYLPQVVPLAYSSCNLDDGAAVIIDDYSDDEEDKKEIVNLTGFVSSDDEAQDEPRVRNVSIRTGVLNEKAAATQALGLFALHTKIAYAPYLEESLKIMVKHSLYFHEDVRLQAITGLRYILAAAHAIFQSHHDGESKTKEVVNSAMTIYIKTMNEDDDKEVVAQACMSVTDIINDFGYVAIEPYMPQLVESTMAILQQESACQQIESDINVDDDDPGRDEVLVDAVSDMLAAFSKAMGSQFAPIFATLFDPLMKFLEESHSPKARTMVVACLAEIAQGMGTPISEYINTVMPLVLKELPSSSATNRRNAAFCVGELCKNGGASSLRYFDDVLNGLYPLFGESETDNSVRDNAAGAVSRMIMEHRDSVPLDQVLPVLLEVLPLKEDREESLPVYTCICNLILSNNSQILPLVPDVIRIFAQVVVSPLETPQVKAEIGRAFTHLLSVYDKYLYPILRNLPPTHANALAAIAPPVPRPPPATAKRPPTG